MANKRPLALTNSNSNGGKALRFDITQIKPVIMKRSEIYNKGTSPVSNATTLPSCLRQSRTPGSTATTSTEPQNDACSVQFRSNVTVRRIPSRHDYSESVKAELWSSLAEIRENAIRNEAEFSFDGAQWRTCREEKDFFLDKQSGCLIHPAHVETVCVFNGIEWTPILAHEGVAEQPQQWNIPMPHNQVCIVCDYSE